MSQAVADAISRIVKQVLPLIQSKLPYESRDEAAKVYPEYLRERYQAFFNVVYNRCGKSGLERCTESVTQEEGEFWGGLRYGGVARCLLPSSDYIEFCECSQDIFDKALLASNSGIRLCDENAYDAQISWIKAQIEKLSGEEKAWAKETAEEMYADLDFTYGKNEKISFRLCRFQSTGTRKRIS